MKKLGSPKNIDKSIKKYLSDIGKIGGSKSRRILTTEQSLAMIEAREAKKEKLHGAEK